MSGATDCTRLRAAAVVALCDFFTRNPELLCDCDTRSVYNKVVESCKVCLYFFFALNGLWVAFRFQPCRFAPS